LECSTWSAERETARRQQIARKKMFEQAEGVTDLIRIRLVLLRQKKSRQRQKAIAPRLARAARHRAT
jgi:hypothetical protein